MASKDYGAMIAPYIPHDVDGTTVSVDALAAQVGLHRRSVEKGVFQLRRRNLSESLVSTVAGYRFTTQEGPVARFRILMGRRAISTIISAYQGAIRPLLILILKDEDRRRVEKSFARLLEDMDDLMNHAA